MRARPVFRLLRRLLVAFFLLVLLVLAAGGLFLAASRATLEGTRALPGLAAEVLVERDQNGVPTVHAANADDEARALGFLHAQERFFQMDLLRRRAAGELSELVGAAALPLDRETRRHRFRHRAEETASTRLTPAETRRLDAYAAGVNAGLNALAARPWEYALLRATPRPWTRADSVLVVFAMSLDLQGGDGREERVRLAVSEVYGDAVRDFLWPRVLERTAALDGSSAPAPEVPGEWEKAEGGRRKAEPEETTKASASEIPPSAFRVVAGRPVADSSPPSAFVGSNAFVLAGRRANAGGAALVAGDPHLGLGVPNTWFRVRLERRGGRAVTGESLPGVPGVIIGSNGDVAWAFTNGYVDHSDVVVVDVDPADPARYRVPDGDGWERFTTVVETVPVAHGAAETLATRHTRWGPVLSKPGEARTLALRWVMHEAEAVNFAVWDLAETADVEGALAVAHLAGIPAQNFLVGDRAGHIAWTIIGRVPRRVGFDGFTAGSWADGARRWDGFLPPGEVPVVRDPAEGQLWSSNHRMVGGEALGRLGEGGYDDPARAAQVRDRLTALRGTAATPADLLAVQLDDESRFLRRWADLLLGQVLTDEAVRDDAGLAEMRQLLREWHGHAAAGEAGHRLARQFRLAVLEAVFQPIYKPVHARDPAATGYGAGVEQPLWTILTERPAHLLPATAPSWDALLRAAARATVAEMTKDGVPLRAATWGRMNTLKMRHPLSGALPGFLAGCLDMPAEPLPGDSRMPRVQLPAFGASMRMVVAPGHEAEGIQHQPGGASGHPLSPFYRAGHEAWATGQARPFLPGETRHRLTLRPGG